MGLACTLFQYANVFRPRGHVRYLVYRNDIEEGVNKNDVEDNFIVARELKEDSERFRSSYRVTQGSSKCCALLNKQIFPSYKLEFSPTSSTSLTFASSLLLA